jgi:putative endonuclease
MLRKHYYVYIMANIYNNVLYTGVTDDPIRRVIEHKSGNGGLFTSKCKVNKLGYYIEGEDISIAIMRDKEIKGGSRKNKIELINRINPEWNDLFEEIGRPPDP